MNTDIAIAPQPALSRRAHASRRFLIWAAVLLPFLVVALWRLPDGPGDDADDYGQYLMHAQALAEGRPYTDIGYIYSRFRYGIGPVAAPPGLPLTLAAIYVVFGPNMAAMKFVMLCFATTFVVLAALYFARHEDPRIGMGVGLLCGLSPDIAHGSSQLLTDLPFAALIWAVIYLVDLPGKLNLSRVLAITILGALAMAFRVPGVVLFPALILFTALRYRDHGLRPALPPLVWLIGVLILAAAMPIEKVAVISFGRVLEWDLAQLVENAKGYWPAIFDSHLHPFPAPVANDVFHVVTGVLMAIGLISWVRKASGKFGTIFAFGYSAMLLIVPLNQGRYLWPLFPFLVFGLLNGVRVIGSRFSLTRPEQASAAALVFALILVPPAMIKVITEPRRIDLMTVPEVQTIVHEIREEASATTPVRVIFYKPRSFAWVTGIPAMGAIGGPPECLISEMSRGRISHVILGGVNGQLDGILQHRIRRLTLQRPDLLAEMLRTKNFVAYRFQVSASEAAEAQKACSQRPRWRRSATPA